MVGAGLVAVAVGAPLAEKPVDEDPRAAPTNIALAVGGSGDTATEGTDYETIGDLAVTIPAGAASATTTFTPRCSKFPGKMHLLLLLYHGVVDIIVILPNLLIYNVFIL